MTISPCKLKCWNRPTYILFPSPFPVSSCSGAKVGSCFLSNTCLGLGVEVLSRLELRLEGLTFRNFATEVSVVDDFSMAWVVGMLLLDSVLYMVVAW